MSNIIFTVHLFTSILLGNRLSASNIFKNVFKHDNSTKSIFIDPIMRKPGNTSLNKLHTHNPEYCRPTDNGFKHVPNFKNKSFYSPVIKNITLENQTNQRYLNQSTMHLNMFKHNIHSTKTRLVKNNKSRNNVPSKKRGKVFKDSKEDILHYKLIDNMLFKPLESNNSASIVFSDESEGMTDDDIKQAIEGREGNYFAIPLKRKKDAYKEFLKWAHLHERNERKVKIEKELYEKYKAKLKLNANFNLNNRSNGSTTGSNVSRSNMYTSQIYSTISNVTNITKSQFEIVPTCDKIANIKQTVEDLKNVSKSVKKQHFKVESIEFQYDPNLLQNLAKGNKKEEQKTKRKRGKKNRKKKKKKYINERDDISEVDYSAQEKFMFYSQKEAMGRRFYKMFANKSVSDFWDNSTLETTKMLETIIPLGEHLHKTLDKLPLNEGEHFLPNLRMYKTLLEKFVVLVKQDKGSTRRDVVELLEEPYDHVCETKYCEEEVKIMFGWNDEEYKQFETVLDETRELWFDLQLFHHCYQFVSESSESVSASFNCSNLHEQNKSISS